MQDKKRFNIIFGGPAGSGPNILTNLFGNIVVKMGYNVFYSRDYQSLIRGGHNFNILTFSEEPVQSNDAEMDVLVCLDGKTEELHKKNLGKKGIILKNSKDNINYAGRLLKIFGIDFAFLDGELKKLDKKRYGENIISARKGYDEEKAKLFELKKIKRNFYGFMNGNRGVADGAVKSGIEIYYAYPMTPATPVLNELAQNEKVKVIELENEIAVANAGVGSVITGAKVMVGTSGGGFDLMTETLSLCGIAGVPLVFYLSQRPGPATGVATYTAQGDLNIAVYSGHGEFNRIVVAPGNPTETEELTNQAFYLSHKFKIPSVILTDKHLAESFYTSYIKPKIISVKNTTALKKYNSYESDSYGISTENKEIIKKNIEARLEQKKQIISEARKFSTHEIHGNKNSANVIVSWGSTKGAIIDAIKEMKNVCFVQVKYIEPFPTEIKEILKNKKKILVENNSTGQLGNLIAEKTGIFIDDKNKILKYDGRPFTRDELEKEIGRRLK